MAEFRITYSEFNPNDSAGVDWAELAVRDGRKKITVGPLYGRDDTMEVVHKLVDAAVELLRFANSDPAATVELRFTDFT